jgi:hypothetical protein
MSVSSGPCCVLPSKGSAYALQRDSRTSSSTSQHARTRTPVTGATHTHATHARTHALGCCLCTPTRTVAIALFALAFCLAWSRAAPRPAAPTRPHAAARTHAPLAEPDAQRVAREQRGHALARLPARGHGPEARHHVVLQQLRQVSSAGLAQCLRAWHGGVGGGGRGELGQHGGRGGSDRAARGMQPRAPQRSTERSPSLARAHHAPRRAPARAPASRAAARRCPAAGRCWGPRRQTRRRARWSWALRAGTAPGTRATQGSSARRRAC